MYSSWDAYNQLQTYKEEIGDLFAYNEALVVSDGFNARVGFLTANKEWFMPWRTIRDERDNPVLEYNLEKVVRGFFDRELGDNNLRGLAKEVTEKLKKSTTVDWQVRESVRAKLRILVRRALKKWKYPPDKAAEAVELVLKQAEALSMAWSG